jgi:hypothetical protein
MNLCIHSCSESKLFDVKGTIYIKLYKFKLYTNSFIMKSHGLACRYHITGWLNEKSDVYSFGVALLQIITSRPVILRSAQVNSHVSQWVSSMLSNGDIKSIVDPKLRGDFEVNSAWKAVELARDCISETSTGRPNMSEVVTRLKECLGAELARMNESRVSGTTDSSIVFSMNSGLSPSAR